MSDTNATTSTMLFNHLFEACNILRGPINQDEYKTYVIPILFFKRISDTYDEETARAIKEYGDDIDDFDEDELHTFLIPEGCHWKDVRAVSENVGLAIVNAMTGIERCNPDTLGGVFSSFDDANWTDKNKLSDARLKDLVEHMSSLRVGNNDYSSDVMGDAYEYLIKKFADLSKKNAGEFYTPRSIVKLLISILDPKPGETVYDPACGTGGMLIEAIHHMKDMKSTYGNIFGQEKNLATSAIARMNLYLHGAQDFFISQGDTLLSPSYMFRGELRKFDCVIANPPFSLDNWGSNSFENDPFGRNIWGVPPANNADYAWIQHMVSSMKKGSGRCAVILPLGVLFRSTKEKSLREKMIESDKLECVITLADNLFYGAELSTAVLVFRDNKASDRKNKVLLINASGIYQSGRAQNYLTDKNAEEILELYERYENVEQISRVLSIEDIKESGYVVTPRKLLGMEQDEIRPFDEVVKEYYKTIAELEDIEEKLFSVVATRK